MPFSTDELALIFGIILFIAFVIFLIWLKFKIAASDLPFWVKYLLLK